MQINFTPILNCSGHFDAVLRVAFSRDGRQLASVGADGQLRVIDLETAQCKCSAALHSGSIHDVCWDGLGKFIYTVGSEGDVVCSAVSCLPSQSITAPRECHDPEISGVVVRFPHNKENPCINDERLQCLNRFATAVSSPQHIGQYIVTGGYDALIRQWDVRKFGHVCDVRSHDAPVSSLEHSHDDSLIVSSSLDGFARLWDSTGLALVRTYRGVDGIPLAHAIFSPTSDKLVCIPLESTCRIWNVIHPEVFQNLENLKTDSCPSETFPSQAPTIPTLEKPFVGQTAAEFLTSPGPFVFGTFAMDGDLVIVPQAPSVPPHLNSCVYGVGVWSASCGKLLKLLNPGPHKGCPVTSVSGSPSIVYSQQRTFLLATSGDFPDNNVIIWCSIVQ